VDADLEGFGCAGAGVVGVGGYGADMSRFRLLPTPEQEQALLAHCRDARYVWNLAVEQPAAVNTSGDTRRAWRILGGAFLPDGRAQIPTIWRLLRFPEVADGWTPWRR
jgi:hypothetical protein